MSYYFILTYYTQAIFARGNKFSTFWSYGKVNWFLEIVRLIHGLFVENTMLLMWSIKQTLIILSVSNFFTCIQCTGNIPLSCDKTFGDEDGVLFYGSLDYVGLEQAISFQRCYLNQANFLLSEGWIASSCFIHCDGMCSLSYHISCLIEHVGTACLFMKASTLHLILTF